jgi:hypothetical protein
VSLLSPAPGEEGGEEEEDAVERIVEQRRVLAPGEAPQVLYRVRWRGAGPEEDEWFPRADLLQDFPHCVAEFERGEGQRRP